MESRANVLIVDDSRLYRAVIETVFGNDPSFRVVGSVYSGAKALEFVRSTPVDLVTLDVEMPEMNGLQTLEGIQDFNRQRPAAEEVGVIMISAFTQRGAEITVKALQAGAFDFVTKPTGDSQEDNLQRLQRELIPRVRLFLTRRKLRAARTHAADDRHATQQSDITSRRTDNMAIRSTGMGFGTSAVTTASIRRRPVRAVVVGASTGGPKALATILPELVSRIDAPIVVVQHMPAEFTRSLAEHFMRSLGIPVTEVEERTPLMARHVYIARGGHHATLRALSHQRLWVEFADGELESGCRPSANVLFRSAADALGAEGVAIILTGMGDDGAAGLRPFHEAGGYVIAQDEETSVVWGMPGAAVAAGAVDTVVPLHEIPRVVDAVALPIRSP